MKVKCWTVQCKNNIDGWCNQEIIFFNKQGCQDYKSTLNVKWINMKSFEEWLKENCPQTYSLYHGAYEDDLKGDQRKETW